MIRKRKAKQTLNARIILYTPLWYGYIHDIDIALATDNIQALEVQTR